jgi:hypothetical protein
MDLLAMFRAVLRNRLLTIPVILLTLVGGVWVYFFSSPTYEATSSYIVFEPPAAPTASEIAEDPALAKVNADNPYARVDPSVVAGIIVKRAGSPRARAALTAEGADQRYKIALGGAYGVASPTVDVTGVGSTAASAVKTADLVGDRLDKEVNDIQSTVDDRYRVKAVQTEAVQGAQLKESSRLRSLLGLLGAGLVLLFVAVSIGEAVRGLRKERSSTVQRRTAPDQLSPFMRPNPTSRGDRVATTNGPDRGERTRSHR